MIRRSIVLVFLVTLSVAARADPVIRLGGNLAAPRHSIPNDGSQAYSFLDGTMDVVIGLPTRGTISIATGFGVPVLKGGDYSSPDIHLGVDIAADSGTRVLAALSGTIEIAAWTEDFGNYVVLKHDNGLRTIYGHLVAFRVTKKGQAVKAGEVIAYSGATGLLAGGALHFAIVKDKNEYFDPVPYLGSTR